MLVPACNQRLLLCSGSIEDQRKTRCESVPRADSYGGLGRPVSRILLYPAIHLRGIPGLPAGAAPTSPEGPDNLACSHRWFTWPVPRGMPPVGSYPTLSPITCAAGRPHGHRLVCSLLHFTQRRVGRPEPTRIIPYRLYAWLRAPYGATASDEHDPGRREA